MKEYIITDDFLDELTKKFAYAQGHLHELVRCKDCRSRDDKMLCTKFTAYTSMSGYYFTPPDWFYCGYGKRKDE